MFEYLGIVYEGKADWNAVGIYVMVLLLIIDLAFNVI